MTADMAVLVPYRPDGGDRDRAWAYVQWWWGQCFPDWPVVAGTCPDGPWCKAAAVADALTRTDAAVLVIADADVFTHGIYDAVLAAHGSGWAVPHHLVHRLSADATAHVYAGGDLPDPPTRPAAERHTGALGGGMVAVRRDLYERVPLDWRFTGWGGEDIAWARALRVLAGKPWRGAAPLWHLWHPRLDGHTRRRLGHEHNLALYRRYEQAKHPEQVQVLLDEFMSGDTPDAPTLSGE